jgi:hypothetical protein
MNEYSKRRHGAHIPNGKAGSPAEALHTVLMFVIDNHEQFTTWLNELSPDKVNSSDVLAALDDLHEMLNNVIKQQEASPRIQVGQPIKVSRSDLIDLIMNVVENAAEEMEREQRKPTDPDLNTGMFL